MRIDLGDLDLVIEARVKGLRRYGITWRVGVPRDSSASERVVNGPPYATTTGRIDAAMDLQADKKVPLSLGWIDEVGNPTAAPADATVVFTVDDPTIVAVTDNGDGTATAAAVGELGDAVVHVEATAGERTITGDLLITVVAGDAERVEIIAGAPEEVTPDA